MSDLDQIKNQKDFKTLVKSILSAMLGVEPSDLHDEDSFVEDLHMGPADLTDLAERLSITGHEINEFKFGDIETIGDLIDFLNSEEEI